MQFVFHFPHDCRRAGKLLKPQVVINFSLASDAFVPASNIKSSFVLL